MRDAGCGIRDTGYGMRDTGYGMRDERSLMTALRPPVFGLRSSVFGLRSSVFGLPCSVLCPLPSALRSLLLFTSKINNHQSSIAIQFKTRGRNKFSRVGRANQHGKTLNRRSGCGAPRRRSGITRAAAHQDAGSTAISVASRRTTLDVGVHVRFARCEVCALGYRFLVGRRSLFVDSTSSELG